MNSKTVTINKMFGTETDLIHLIWFGDFPKRYVLNLAAFCRAAGSRYRVILWADHPRTARDVIYTKHSKSSGTLFQFFPALHILDINDELLSKDNTVLYSSWPKLKQIIKMERAGAYYNYASACDFLRLWIIFKYGGVYFDLDSYPRKIFPDLSQIPTVSLP